VVLYPRHCLLGRHLQLALRLHIFIIPI
jgi:hypothetical protein